MKTETLKQEINALWPELKNKTEFAFEIAPKVGRSGGTIMRHWFSSSLTSPGLPDEPQTLRLFRSELKKKLRKQRKNESAGA